MDRNTMEFNNYSSSGNVNQFENSFDFGMYETPMINPITQYEQAYMYYKYLTQQMDYRIKCKEYEQLNRTK